MSVGFLHPEALLLLLPAGFVWWRWRSREVPTQVVRALVLLLGIGALAAPYLKTTDSGRDLVVVVDRSRSMPVEGDASALELIRLAEEERGAGDRVAIIGFGARAGIERLPSRQGAFAGFERAIDRDASDLGEALETALELIPDDRPGSILLISDGESNGRDPLASAQRAFARGVRIDARELGRGAVPDLSVERIELPEEVGVGEPFQFTVWVRADERTQATFALERSGQVLSSGQRVFEQGLNRLVFRDVLARAGVGDYRVRLDTDQDRVVENNTGVGGVRVRGQRPVLVLNDAGAEGTLTRTLRSAGIPVEVAAPEGARLDRVGLTAYRALVLENVAAGRLGGPAMSALRDFVRERGGGLLMTGGRASFGIGGYHLSPIDEVLPVSMEMRQESRKLGLALSITMDRSGSMGMEVSPGVQKMDLANLGASAAIELLSPIDSVGVIAVDSSPHEIQALTRVESPGALISKVRRIKSMGGGIFTYTALLAAGRQLEKAEQRNRHIILFADANDSEEQERCPELIERLREMNTTLSVIALGTESDSDADFLKRIAALGGGEVYFTTDPTELPRLFAQDTMMVARATFIEEPTACTALPDLFGLGELGGRLGADGFPPLAGYNLTYLRSEGTAGVVTTDDYHAPVLAFAYHGLGRSATYAGQIGGEFGGDVTAWSGFGSFFVTLVRWLSGQEEPAEFFSSVRREGAQAVVSVEVDPRAPTPPDTSGLTARLTLPDGRVERVPMARVGEHRYEARVPLAQGGIALGSVELGDGRFLGLSPVALPYSPEFETGTDPERGARLLRSLVTETGGQLGVTAADLYRGERGGRAWRVITRELLLAALLLFLVEVAFRRLQLWGSVARAGGALRETARGLRRAPAPEAKRPAREAPRRGASPEPEVPTPAAPSTPEPAPAPEPSLGEALRRARGAADRRLGR